MKPGKRLSENGADEHPVTGGFSQPDIFKFHVQKQVFFSDMKCKFRSGYWEDMTSHSEEAAIGQEYAGNVAMLQIHQDFLDDSQPVVLVVEYSTTNEAVCRETVAMASIS